MALTPEQLQANLDEVNAAIAAPERQVTLGSQNVTLRSIDDLIKARNQIEADLAAINATTTGVVRSKQRQMVYTGRGFNSGC